MRVLYTWDSNGMGLLFGIMIELMDITEPVCVIAQ